MSGPRVILCGGRASAKRAEAWLAAHAERLGVTECRPRRWGHGTHPAMLRLMTESLYVSRETVWLVNPPQAALDCLWFDTEAEVSERLWRWHGDEARSIAVEDAGRFYRAYQAGIQHVSHILLGKGIWTEEEQ